MQKLVLTVSLLLVGTLVRQGQQEQNSFSSNSSVSSSNSSVSSESSARSEGRLSAPDYRRRDAPIGSLSENFVYMYAPGQYGANRSLMGWEVVPTLTPAHGFGLQADFASLYMRSVYPGQSWLIMAAGPRYDLAPRSRFTPFIFGEAGEMRLESQRKRNVDWEPVAKAGFGFETRVTRHFGMTLVPAEWMGIRYDYNSSWSQNFTAHAGLTFYLGGGKGPTS